MFIKSEKQHYQCGVVLCFCKGLTVHDRTKLCCGTTSVSLKTRGNVMLYHKDAEHISKR